jgi:hypothetical protein
MNKGNGQPAVHLALMMRAEKAPRAILSSVVSCPGAAGLLQGREKTVLSAPQLIKPIAMAVSTAACNMVVRLMEKDLWPSWQNISQCSHRHVSSAAFRSLLICAAAAASCP